MISRTILFVDDDALTQWVMADALTEAGCEVTSACRGMEACRLIEEAHGFDVLITDIDLPDVLTGTDLARVWHGASPNRPVLYIGSVNHPAVRHLERHETFLAKPFTPDMLLDAVQQVLEDAAYGRPRAAGARVCHVH